MLTAEQAYTLESISETELNDLCASASNLRESHWGDIVTYSRKVFIPLTNMCRDTCKYCTFVKTPESGEANLMTPDDVLATARAGDNLGCKEALFSLGERPEKRYRLAKDLLAAQGHDSTVSYLYAMAELVMQRSQLVPHINAGALTENELRFLRPVAGSMGMMLETNSPRLMQPGQAHHACPDKQPKRRMATLEAAGKLDIPFTTGLLIGIGETWQERVDSLIAINQCHQQYGHIQEVIIQNFRAKEGTDMAGAIEPSQQDMLKTLAVARLILDPSISLQAPPNLEQDYARYLDAGINDWGGISPVTRDFINPERAWPQIETLRKQCQAQQLTLQERLTVYPSYLKSGARYLAENVNQRMQLIASSSGLAAHQCF
ncbi:7,8-didemethyl-8-hydroxy-5-deazariboflavin synthase CofG [Reinekea thalattae]|uniref:7,8-didemethyl-8-hydroxy-5-deazariboflavin synthase n=1 Tax=Reinekea thalattae TaxID=2593301 RepID=A0A5C8ZB92_9GAMM|nr:7,8-didemethyl-8-hydroxy-5-deazariboflavin synthase CofG [Reinekea thalattae]TXR54423.1 7,8-didemethyl-8-hydroxy-5-deazariboflavin synthase subunit CofG [Reinekea thalattae]